ncbi:MAG: heme ABC transporter permease [Gammaproteobacteria bacterium SG8_31]|jgi:heme exporter protein C|nr:MAG: heme ABC transporter permease [Gammaproteobacteria bacterium SG8_31]
MWTWFHKLGSPPHFYRISAWLTPWFAWAALVLIVIGAYGGLYIAPADYQQLDGFRIIYVHVPSASLSLFIYVNMAIAAAVGLIWRIKLAHAVAAACAPIGASFTFLALATGSIWAKPMWGTWWVWDARLTSELVLLFLYFGYMALRAAIDDDNRADRASALLAIIGVVNVPIIKYSVEWWNTLHQPATISKLGKPSMDFDMLIWLLVMLAGFMCFFAAVLLTRVRAEVLVRSRGQKWLKQALQEN